MIIQYTDISLQSGEPLSLDHWIYRASLYELLAQTYFYTTEELTQAIITGEYAEALFEILALNAIAAPSGIEETLLAYQGRDSEDVLHELRREYTRLFIGSSNPIVPPFGGTWHALKKGETPLLFVGKESMSVERFMRRCGVTQPEGTNEPLDHLSSELEFLQYLCLLKAEVVVPSEGIEILAADYEDFYNKHFRWLAECFAEGIIKECRVPFFAVGAKVLLSLPKQALEDEASRHTS